MARELMQGICRHSGEELGVNEKMRSATVHVRCAASGMPPTSGRVEPGEAIPVRRYARIDGGRPSAPAVDDGGPSKYKGALFTSNFLRIVGWISVFLTPVIAIAAAASYTCEDGLFSQCSESDVTGIRVGLFVGILLAGWLYSALMLAIGYAVLLLSDIEASAWARDAS